MLEMRRFCECCSRSLAPDKFEAMICSFECTFCTECATVRLKGKCPNCGGNLLIRPTRPSEKMAANPPSARVVVKAGGCPSTDASWS